MTAAGALDSPSRGRDSKSVDSCVHPDVHNYPRSARLVVEESGREGGSETYAPDAIPVVGGLPTLRGGWRRDADLVVVGSGAAGISAALSAAGAGLRVLMVTKDLVGGATALAQGGLAAAIGPQDSTAAHVGDTLAAGAGLCEPDVVAALADGAPGALAGFFPAYRAARVNPFASARVSSA